jgi:hypothetical protein
MYAYLVAFAIKHKEDKEETVFGQKLHKILVSECKTVIISSRHRIENGGIKPNTR